MTAIEWWEQLKKPISLDVENDWNIECGTKTARGAFSNLTQNPKTDPKETRVILGRAVLERRRDDAEESSQRRTDRDRVAARRNGREGGGYLPEGGDQRGELLRVEEALCRVGD